MFVSNYNYLVVSHISTQSSVNVASIPPNKLCTILQKRERQLNKCTVSCVIDCLTVQFNPQFKPPEVRTSLSL